MEETGNTPLRQRLWQQLRAIRCMQHLNDEDLCYHFGFDYDRLLRIRQNQLKKTYQEGTNNGNA